MKLSAVSLAVICSLFLAAAADGQNARDRAVRQDKQRLSGDDSWFYDDLNTALRAAADSKRPLMVVFR